MWFCSYHPWLIPHAAQGLCACQPAAAAEPPPIAKYTWPLQCSSYQAGCFHLASVSCLGCELGGYRGWGAGQRAYMIAPLLCTLRPSPLSSVSTGLDMLSMLNTEKQVQLFEWCVKKKTLWSNEFGLNRVLYYRAPQSL